MKRLRILPSILMLVACIAVLCVGIYAVSPVNNEISGTISISSMAKVKITGYINGEKLYDTKSTADGISWSLNDSNALHFDAFNAESIDEIPQKIIRIRIENLTDKPLGAYFYNGSDTLDENDLATYESLEHNVNIYPKDIAEADRKDSDIIAKATLSTYSYIAAENTDNTYDEVDMYIVLDVAKLAYEATEGSFTFRLRIEEYSSNVDTENYNTTSETKIVKFSEKVSDTARTSITSTTAIAGNANAKIVVLPTTITSIGASAFAQCTSLEHIIIPRSVTTMGEACFDRCASLISVSTPISGVRVTHWYTSDVLYQFPKFFGTTSFDDSKQYAYSGINYDGNNGCAYSTYLPISLNMIYLTGTSFEAGMFGIGGYSGNIIIGEYITRLGCITRGSGGPAMGAFSEMDIKKIFIPKNVVNLGDMTFYNCLNLASVTFAPGCVITTITTESEYGGYNFGCPLLKELEIFLNTDCIGDETFNARLQSLIIHNEKSTFEWCDWDGSVLPNSLCYLELPAFTVFGGNSSGQVFLPTPSIAGKTFLGWSYNGDTESLVAGGAAISTAGGTYEAVFA